MDETVISWNLPNVITFLMMLAIIWIIFGFVGHFVFRAGSKKAASTTGAMAFSPSGS